MKVYVIVEVDSYGYEFTTTICFASKEKAEKYCVENNKDAYDYLQSCADDYERPGNYTLFEVKELEVKE